VGRLHSPMICLHSSLICVAPPCADNECPTLPTQIPFLVRVHFPASANCPLLRFVFFFIFFVIRGSIPLPFSAFVLFFRPFNPQRSSPTREVCRLPNFPTSLFCPLPSADVSVYDHPDHSLASFLSPAPTPFMVVPLTVPNSVLRCPCFLTSQRLCSDSGLYSYTTPFRRFYDSLLLIPGVAWIFLPVSRTLSWTGVLPSRRRRELSPAVCFLK